MKLEVGVDAWIIQDGNYGDFTAGSSYRFALEFSPHALTPVDASVLRNARTRALEYLGGAQYRVCGEIVAVTGTVWVIDFGVSCFQEAAPPEWARIGVFVVGRVYIGLDPFFYLERLKNEPGMPDLFGNWLVRKIRLETTPWLTTEDAKGRKLLARDATREAFVDVAATDAWHDDEGRGHYLMDCESE